jgi:hypothetical protein
MLSVYMPAPQDWHFAFGVLPLGWNLPAVQGVQALDAFTYS